VMVIDPVSNLTSSGTLADSRAMLTRLLDLLKMRQITTLMTNLTTGGRSTEVTEIGISSVVDNWLLLRDVELSGERNRVMYVLKARGTAHSNQVREFLLTSRGIELIPAYVGPSGVLTGSARVAQEARERAEAIAQERQLELRRRERALEKARVEMQIAALRAQLEEDERDTARGIDLEAATEIRREDDRAAMARSRRVTAPKKKP